MLYDRRMDILRLIHGLKQKENTLIEKNLVSSVTQM